MPHTCYVSNCNMRSGKDGISVHRFPNQFTEQDRFQKWVDFCRRDDAPKGSSYYVCSLHFTRDMYSQAYQLELLGSVSNRRLKPDAVPTEKGPTERRTPEQSSRQKPAKSVEDIIPCPVIYTNLTDLINDAANVDTKLLLKFLVLPVDQADQYCVFYRSNATGQSPSSAFERCIYFRNTLEPRVELLGRQKFTNSQLPASDIVDRQSLETLLHWLDTLIVCHGITADDGRLREHDAVCLDSFLPVPVMRSLECDLMFCPSSNRIRCPSCSEFQIRINKRKKQSADEIPNATTN